MMRKKLSLLFAVLVAAVMCVNAQVTIGADKEPHAGAVLDLKSTNKGLLLPNVSLQGVNDWSLDGTSVDGMIVYNTGGALLPGVYIWITNQWVPMNGGATSAATLQSIRIDSNPAKTIYNVGESFDPTGLTISAVYSDGSAIAVPLSACTFTPDPLTMGTTDVTVTYLSKTALVSGITVNVAVTGVTLNKTTTSFEVGETETLIATVQPTTATNQAVTWSTTDATIATVDAAGKVTGVAEGTATITVTTTDGNFTASCTVTVNARTTNPDGSVDMQIGNNTYKTYTYDLPNGCR